MFAACSKETMLKRRDAVNMADNSALLARIACPTLVLHGARDPIYPIAQAQKLASGIADAQLVVLDTANHCPMPGNAAYPAYRAALTEFLAKAR